MFWNGQDFDEPKLTERGEKGDEVDRGEDADVNEVARSGDAVACGAGAGHAHSFPR